MNFRGSWYDWWRWFGKAQDFGDDGDTKLITGTGHGRIVDFAELVELEARDGVVGCVMELQVWCC